MNILKLKEEVLALSSRTIDATRVEEQKVRRMQLLLNLNRLFAVLLFLSGFGLVISLIDTSIWNFKMFWWGLKFFIFLFELVFLLAGYGITLMLGYSDPDAVALMMSIHNAIFGGNDTILGLYIEDLIVNPLQIPAQQNIIDSIYAFSIIVTIMLAFIAGMGFIRECNPGLSAISFFALNIVLGLASLNGKLLIDVNFNSGNILEMIFSKMVITAFLLYLYLELSFQANYIYSVISPNIHRHRRISSNIKRLKEFKLPTGQTLAQQSEASNSTSRISVKGKNTTTSRLTVVAAFSKIRGLVGKKLFRINVGEDWDKLNHRLKNYYQQLEKNDPFMSISLSASAHTPSMSRLILIISTGTIFRIGALMIFSWLALNPIPVLRVLHMPSSIIDSIEASQPEMIMLVLIPLALSFLLVGLLVHYIQKRLALRLERYQQGLVIHPVSPSLETKKQLQLRKKTPESRP